MTHLPPSAPDHSGCLWTFWAAFLLVPVLPSVALRGPIYALFTLGPARAGAHTETLVERGHRWHPPALFHPSLAGICSHSHRVPVCKAFMMLIACCPLLVVRLTALADEFRICFPKAVSCGGQELHQIYFP